MLRAKAPWMKAAQAQVRAAVIQQLMKAAVAMQAQNSLPHRAAIIDELERVIRLHLDDTLRCAEADRGAAASPKARDRPSTRDAGAAPVAPLARNRS